MSAPVAWPGPWKAVPDPSNPTGDWLVSAPESTEHVAVCAPENAPLIAAAPEMRAALELAQQALSAVIGCVNAIGRIDPQWDRSILVEAKTAAQASRLALAKANRSAA